MTGFEPRTSGSEATALSTEPQPLPYGFDSHMVKEYFTRGLITYHGTW